MKAAGLGGFRIYPVYAFPGAQLPLGTVNHAYLSPEYVQLVRTAVEHGNAAGLAPETFLTSGWPYGGPWISPELGAGQLKYTAREVSGPVQFKEQVPGQWRSPERLLAVSAAQVSASGGVDIATAIDLTRRVSEDRTIEWSVPPGRWLLMTFVSGYTGMKVKRAAPGGEGLVLDHFNRDALAAHLQAVGDVQKEALAGALAIGVDSWEVYDSNWTPRLPAEFERRRGYSLTPLLPALFLPFGDTGARVRYDFRRTLSELAIENFFAPLAEWAHAAGLKVRSQAHGTPADVIEAYGASDFPEGETYGPEDRLAIDIRDRKLASSAAHLFGLNQVSAESFTWLRFPMFRVTLEEMKAAADAIYLDGINQVNYHGVPFSPAWAQAPGFYFYASTLVSPGNTWWPYLTHLSAYIRRVNFMLQQGQPVVDIAVYAPYEDVWSSAMGSWTDLAGGIAQRMQEDGSIEMLRSLRSAGYDFDFINAQRLSASWIEDGKLAIGPMRYKVVLLPSLTKIDADALERLSEFCRAGGILVANERIPDQSPGFVHQERENARVASIAEELWGTGGSLWQDNVRIRGRAIGKGKALLIPPDRARNLSPPLNAAAQAISTLVESDCQFEEPDSTVGFVHRSNGSTDVYFIANISPAEKSTRIRFRRAAGSIRIFDPEKGEVGPASSRERVEGGTRVTVSLRPWGSIFVVLGETANHESPFEADTPVKMTVLPIVGLWKVTRTGVPTVSVSHLDSWTNFPGWRHFSGTASYTTTFVLPRSVPGANLSLDLGEVEDIAEVLVNGLSLGVVWKHPYAVDVSRAIRSGSNKIEIRVTNRLFNRMLAEEHELPPPYYQVREYAAAPERSGLMGPVVLKVRQTRAVIYEPRTSGDARRSAAK